MTTTETEQAEITALREQVERLTAVVAEQGARLEAVTRAPQADRRVATSSAEHAMSRRTMLRSLAGAGTGAALGAAAVALTGAPAGAVNGDPVLAGQETNATNTTIVRRGSQFGVLDSAALAGLSEHDVGVAASSTNNIGVGARSSSQVFPAVSASNSNGGGRHCCCRSSTAIYALPVHRTCDPWTGIDVHLRRHRRDFAGFDCSLKLVTTSRVPATRKN